MRAVGGIYPYPDKGRAHALVVQVTWGCTRPQYRLPPERPWCLAGRFSATSEFSTGRDTVARGKIWRWGGVLALLLTLIGASLPQVPAASAASPALPTGQERVCDDPAPGEYGCHAIRRTNSGGSDGASPAIASSIPYGPADLQDAYNLTAAAASAGATQTIAIVDAFDNPNAEADMGLYRSTYGLPACTTAN